MSDYCPRAYNCAEIKLVSQPQDDSDADKSERRGDADTLEASRLVKKYKTSILHGITTCGGVNLEERNRMHRSVQVKRLMIALAVLPSSVTTPTSLLFLKFFSRRTSSAICI